MPTTNDEFSSCARSAPVAACALLLLASALTACAHEQPSAPVDVTSLSPLPRSSIAAIVQQRAKLGLTDDEVRELEEIDQAREKADAAFTDEVAQKQKAAQAAGTGAGGGPPAGGGRSGGMRGGGMRGGGMGGGGMGGRRGPPQAGPGAANGTAPATIQDHLDENDTKAFLDAEQVLTEAQRDAAREIAGDYRAQLYERRELPKNDAK